LDILGDSLGNELGLKEMLGLLLGDSDGYLEGRSLGLFDGCALGDSDGFLDGRSLGLLDGYALILGDSDGFLDGWTLGRDDGLGSMKRRGASEKVRQTKKRHCKSMCAKYTHNQARQYLM
jgi:hypothetical protein